MSVREPNLADRRSTILALTEHGASVLDRAGGLTDDSPHTQRQSRTAQNECVALIPPSTSSQAARRLGTTRQAVQRTTNDLLAQGLAVSHANPDHRTAPLIDLTPAGRDVLEQISKAASRQRRRWFADHDADGLEAAHVEIRRLRDTLRDQVAQDF